MVKTGGNVMDFQKETEAFLSKQPKEIARIFSLIEFCESLNIFRFKEANTKLDLGVDLHILNYGWSMWQARAQPEPTLLENDCMIDQVWFMKGTPVINLIKHAEGVYQAEVATQNSKIEFGTDDNKIWWAHDVPFYGRVQLERFEEHGMTEWDIHFNECWQGPFDSKAKAIEHLETCIAEQRQEQGA